MWENYTCCRLWKHSTSTKVFIPILMHVCQCLQMSSLRIRSVSCCARSIYYTESASLWRETEKRMDETERWVLTWPCPSLWLLLLGCTTRCHLRGCVCVGGNAEQVREEEPWQERMKEGGISGGGRGRDRVKTNRIKKNKVVAVAIKNFYAQWVQWSLWGVLNEHRAASNEIPTENRGAIQTDS